MGRLTDWLCPIRPLRKGLTEPSASARSRIEAVAWKRVTQLRAAQHLKGRCCVPIPQHTKPFGWGKSRMRQVLFEYVCFGINPFLVAQILRGDMRALLRKPSGQGRARLEKLMKDARTDREKIRLRILVRANAESLSAALERCQLALTEVRR